MINIQQLYDNAPPFIQNTLLNIYSAKLYAERYGREFQEISTELKKTQWYTKSEMEDYQTSRLITIINHCYKTVPYYKNLFDSINLKPSDIQQLSDLAKIPILTKKIIRENTNDLLSTEQSYKTRSITFGGTSGTTGTPLRVGWDKRMRIFNNAVDWRQKQWAGINPGDRIAMLLGRPIVSLSRTTPPFWQYDRLQNFLWMSAFHFNTNYLHAYIERLQKFRPKAIEGYPSTLFEFAKYVLSSKSHIKVEAVFSSSEPLHEHYRDTIEKAFGCKVFDFYGLAERTIFASQCSNHTGHHLNFEYGITEFVNIDNHVTDNGGYLVTTSLQNYGMPLLRYKLTDKTSLINEECTCGRKSPRIKSIATKEEDMIYKVDGTPISPSILTHPFKPITSINKSQIIQSSESSITIKIVTSKDYSARDESMLLSSFSQRVGTDMNVVIKIVDDIPREKSGKYKWVVGLPSGD
jgi:phenylacetate-CoA ligase